MQKLVLVILMSVLVFSCASTGSMLTTENRMRTIPVDYMATLKAAESYIQERGFKIMKSDETKGRVESHYREGVGWGEGFTGDKRMKVIAQLKKVDEANTQIIVELISEVRDQYSGWQPVETGDIGQEQIYYTRFLEGIVARAEGRSIK